MNDWNSFIAPNAGLLFYRRLYAEDSIRSRLYVNNDDELSINVPAKGPSPFDEFYDALYDLDSTCFEQIENPGASNTFSLITTYPGMLIGSGYNHQTKARGDASIGFYFDHTTGQPIIPGSSVKGVCRSVFELDSKDGNDYTGEIAFDFFQHLLDDISENQSEFRPEITQLKNKLTEPKDLNLMMKEIFGDHNGMGEDIFFDAVPDLMKTGSNTIFYSDFITPHRDPLKNPTPIQFLKVGPGVFFEFRFKLSKAGGCTPDLKAVIFQQILLTLGICAKTNVGYGQLAEPPEPVRFDEGQEIMAHIAEADVTSNAFIFSIPNSLDFRKQVKQSLFKHYKVGDEVVLIVVKVKDDGSIRSVKIKR